MTNTHRQSSKLVPMIFTLVSRHDDVMLSGRRDFAGGAKGWFGIREVP